MLQRKLGTEVRVYVANKYMFIMIGSPSKKKVKFITENTHEQHRAVQTSINGKYD
jgi:hypothetical protein